MESGAIIPRETYDSFYKEFNPTEFDAEQWCELMKRWGVKFISPTAKHHDGFALWFSDYSDYDMEIAVRKIDIMAELKQACQKHGIMLGTYYSNLDWFHPDWAPYQYGGPGEFFPKQADSPNLARYFDYMENQVIELIEKYGVKFIQFDGEWDSTYTHEVGSMLYRKFREADPDVLLSNRIDIGRRSQGASNHMYIDGSVYCGDFLDRERLVNHGNNVTEWYDDAWQAWVTIDKSQWSYNPAPKLMTVRELIDDAISVLGSNGNYMINLGPRPDGSFAPEQIALMDSLGVWLNWHADAIYGTRGGPYYPFEEGVSTKKGNKAWLFITDRSAKSVELPSLGQKIVSAKIYGTQQKIRFDDSEEITNFMLPKTLGDEIRVVELTFAQKVEMGERKTLPNEFERAGFKRMTEGVAVTYSSQSEWMPDATVQEELLRGEDGKTSPSYAFHTNLEKNPYIVIDLGSECDVAGLYIFNREGPYASRAEGLSVWVSPDAKSWTKEWQSHSVQNKWSVPFTTKSMGAEVMGVKTRFIKIGIQNTEQTYLHLPRIDIYTK